MIIIKLSWFEVFEGACAGVMRRIEALKKKRPEPYEKPAYDPWGIDIESCCAEKAVAKAFNRYWLSVASTPSTLPGDGVEQEK